MSECRIKKPWRMSTHLFPEFVTQKRHLSFLMVSSTNSNKLWNSRENLFQGLIVMMFYLYSFMNGVSFFEMRLCFINCIHFHIFDHIVFINSYFISFENYFKILLPRNNFCMLIIISKNGAINVQRMIHYYDRQ